MSSTTSVSDQASFVQKQDLLGDVTSYLIATILFIKFVSVIEGVPLLFVCGCNIVGLGICKAVRFRESQTRCKRMATHERRHQ